jgi:hypothetical protein
MMFLWIFCRESFFWQQFISCKKIKTHYFIFILYAYLRHNTLMVIKLDIWKLKV